MNWLTSNRWTVDEKEFIYKIKIEEHRENECLKELTITTEEVRSSMPEF